jgi:hypothetical protein
VTHLADFGSHFRAKIHGFPGFPDRQSSSIKQIQELPDSPGMPRGKGSNDSVPIAGDIALILYLILS